MANVIYLFEFKLNGSADVALTQITSNLYYERYKLRDKPLHWVGVSFSSRKRAIAEWKSETVKQ